MCKPLHTPMDAPRLYQELGALIRRRRRTLEYTQADLAARLGISRGAVANIESGRQNMLLHQLYRLADALELEVHELLPPNMKDQASPTGLPMPEGLTAEQEAQLARVITGKAPMRTSPTTKEQKK